MKHGFADNRRGTPMIYGFTMGTGAYATPRKRRVHSRPIPPTPHPATLPSPAAKAVPA